ncbi:hypothetical protein DFJ73DRAFT_800860 [Zopfochytrium polystomum]|nr:hypothetical protein DFJ73DRAFT_800860 [Zopfochytrium polystomum]
MSVNHQLPINGVLRALQCQHLVDWHLTARLERFLQALFSETLANDWMWYCTVERRDVGMGETYRLLSGGKHASSTLTYVRMSLNFESQRFVLQRGSGQGHGLGQGRGQGQGQGGAATRAQRLYCRMQLAKYRPWRAELVDNLAVVGLDSLRDLDRAEWDWATFLQGAGRQRLQELAAMDHSVLETGPPFVEDCMRLQVNVPLLPGPAADVAPPAVTADSLDNVQKQVYACIVENVWRSRQVLFILNGTAGTGKSRVSGAISGALEPEEVLCAAFTAKAAFAIGGTTLHSLLSIGSRWSLLRGRSLQDLQEAFRPAKLLIVDKYSMHFHLTTRLVQVHRQQVAANDHDQAAFVQILAGLRDGNMTMDQAPKG